MHRVSIELYREEFGALLHWIPSPDQYSLCEAATETVNRLILIEWRGRLTPQMAVTWQMRPHNKRFKVNMPLSVAKALSEELAEAEIGYQLQNVLAALDKLLINLFPHSKTVFLQ